MQDYIPPTGDARYPDIWRMETGFIAPTNLDVRG
jgi:hypothetical protein